MTPKQCCVATLETGGDYYCTRGAGHDGPCAAWPNPLLEVGRTGCSLPNRQSLPRGEERAWDDGYRQGNADGYAEGQGSGPTRPADNPYRGLGAAPADFKRAFPPPVGEGQPGAPAGYWYGLAPQDVVEIVRSPYMTIGEAVSFVKMRLRSEYLAGALEAPVPVFKIEGENLHAKFGLVETGRSRSDVPNVSNPRRAESVLAYDLEGMAPMALAVWAGRVLDRFAEKHQARVPSPNPVRGVEGVVIGWCIDVWGEPVGLADANDGVYTTPSEARIAAAKLAAHRDPSLAWVKS